MLVLVLAALGLCAGLSWLVLRLYREAERSTRTLLTERLEAIGLTASALLVDTVDREAQCKAMARINQLDAAYLFDRDLVVRADARGGTPHALNRMRLDPERVEQARAGKSSVGWAFAVEEYRFLGGYFPIAAPSGQLILVLEAGEAFTLPLVSLRRAAAAAAATGVLLFVIFAIAIVAVARTASSERAAYAQAERASVVSQLAAMVAHEIRNPLGTIRSSAELIRERAAETRDLADDVLEEVDRLNRLTEDFLDLANTRPLAREAVPLRALVDGVVSLVQRRAPDLEVAANVEGAIDGDARRLRQVLLNLLLNAVEAMQGAGASLRITIESARHGDRIRLRIRDRGPGISPEQQRRLFEPFSSTKERGHGLGLTIAKRLVEQHGGTLRYVGDVDGAAFELDLAAASEES